ncbi:MAG: alpha/beta hydrolase [Thermoanaerobaculia bacterium]
MRASKSRIARRAAVSMAAGSAAYLGASYLAAHALSEALISPSGLSPGTSDRSRFTQALKAAAASVHELDFIGDPRDPALLHATFATPGDPGFRTTLIFLHGKGGDAAEWQPDAVAALEAGFNVLCPDLRGHGGSEGDFITFGLLESGDLRLAVARAAEKFGADPDRLAVHACSAGCTVALAFCAGNPSVRALWMESPFGDAREMARHYLHLKSGLPGWLLGLTTRIALSRADARIRRRLGLPGGAGLESVDPLETAKRVRCPVQVVYGAKDELVLPGFVPVLAAVLPRTTKVWRVEGAGHCHHENEASRIMREEYRRRWDEFFARAR